MKHILAIILSLLFAAFVVSALASCTMGRGAFAALNPFTWLNPSTYIKMHEDREAQEEWRREELAKEAALPPNFRKVRNAVAEAVSTNPTTITAETHVDAYAGFQEWNYYRLIILLKDAFHVEVPLSAIKGKTVQQIVNFVSP